MFTPPTSSPHAERQYLHTMVAGALLPFAQSTITALVIAFGVWVIAFFIFDMLDSWKSFVVAFAVTWIFMFLYLQLHWLSLTSIERIVQQDINHDGVIGEPEPTATRRKITIDLSTVSADKGWSQSTLQLPGTEEQLVTFANGLLNGLPLSEKTWTPEKKLYSIQDFRDLKAEMFKHALVEYIGEADKRQGIRLTAKGRETMSQIATPSPTE